MSQSLIRRGLDLYKEDVQKDQKGNKKICNAKQKLSEEELSKMVGTNKKGFRRKLKRLQVKHNGTTLKDKKVKSHHNLYESHKRSDKTDANVRALNLMGLLNKDEKKVIEQAAQRHEAKNMRQKKGKDEKKPASTDAGSQSVFSESDFEKFFKEYNFT